MTRSANATNELAAALEAVGPLRHTDDLTPYTYANALRATLTAGGWHLIHADDLPAGYTPGDAIQGARPPFHTFEGDVLTTIALTNTHAALISQHAARLQRLEALSNEAAQATLNDEETLSDATREIARLRDVINDNARNAEQRLTQLQRELATLRTSHFNHIGGVLTAPHSHATHYQDDDQRLGGHDNPHPTNH